MPEAPAPWKTAFVESSEDYQQIDTSGRDGSNHFMHSHLHRLPDFVTGYDLYTSHAKLLDQSSEVLVAVLRLGPNLAGYPDLIHGGATALLFDDVVGFAAEVVLAQETGPRKNAVTAHLAVDFQASLPLPSTVLMLVRLQARQGRKLWFAAQIVNMEQTLVFATAKVLYMLPRASL